MTRRLLILAMILGLPGLAEAAVDEAPEARQRRLDAFQERRLVVEGTPNPKEPGSPAPSAAPLTLRQGGVRIYHVDFVELMADPSLTRDWEFQRNRDWLLWIGSGLLGMPLGGALFYQNFRGQGPLAPFSTGGASDWRGFGLSLAGAGLALYGAYNLGLWVGENLDWHHPDRLETVSILPRVREWNDRLVEHYNLDPATLPPVPTPQPSVTPTPPPADPFAEPSPQPLASPVLGGPPPSAPYEGTAPAMPTPLPLASPGALAPSGRPAFFGPVPGTSPAPGR